MGDKKKAEDEKKYGDLSWEDRAKRCTGKYNKSSCNKVQHCCFWEYKDPTYEEYQPVCYDFSVFKKFYVRDDADYILKINQVTTKQSVKEGNLCSLLASDDRFPSLRNCSCHYVSEMSSNMIKASFFLLSAITAFLNLM